MPHMKIAYMVATPDLRVDERVTALQWPLDRAFRLLAEAGYDGAELMVGDPDQVDFAGIGRAAREHGLEVAALCTGEMFGQHGLSFMDPDESVRAEAVRRTFRVVEEGAALSAPVNIGRLRGRFYSHVPRGQSLDWMYSAFEKVADHAAERGTSIILEPVAFPFCNTINSTADGMEAVKKVGRECFRLMLDVFTMNMEDASMEAAFKAAADYVDHIHLCDSNRCAPGMGAFDFARIMDMIRAIDFGNYVSAEIYQVPDMETALKKTTEVLIPLVRNP